MKSTELCGGKKSRGLNSFSIRSGIVLLIISAFVGSFYRRQQQPSHSAAQLVRTSEDVAGLPSSKAPFNATAKPNEQALKSMMLELPLSFEEGANPNEFLARANGFALYLKPNAAIIAPTHGAGGTHGLAAKKFPSVSFELAGANTDAKASGRDPLPGKVNYLIGKDPAKWRTNVSTFAKVSYEGVYPGIDLIYYGNQRQLEYDFEVAAGADPSLIRFALGGEAHPRISVEGDLIVRTSAGEVREHKPVIYQEVDGARQTIEGRYVLTTKREVRFEIGSYDCNRKLVIDPTLVYSTYLGGTGDDLGSSIAVDSNNNVYLAGTTGSTNFPTMGPAYPANSGLSDMFVTKINSAGSSIIYSTYVGGSGLDRASGIALDGAGNAYVVGRVDSSSVNFPTTAGVVAPTYRGGDFDGVVFKLNAQGNGLAYSTFIGAEDNDSTEGVAVDANGNAYLIGGSRSHGFPTTPNAYLSSNSGDTDAYLTKINSTATAYLYSTLLGGSGTDRGSSVVVDAIGNAYVAGYTGSTDFPTENAFQNFSGGSFDAFVAKIDTNASGAASLIFCGYLGGIADEKAYGIALDSGANNIYVAGQTSSNNFPVLNPAQPASGGAFDAFIAEISSTGAKVYATYLGGSADDRATGVVVNSAGNAYVTGFTFSTNFPTVNALQIANRGGSDVFVAKLNSAGSAFLYSTYLGGSGNESSTSTVTSTNPIALDASNNAYITGYTAATNFPTASPLQAANGGGQDAFVAKISDAAPASDYTLVATPPSQTISPGGSASFTITATPVGGFTGTIALSVTGLSSDSSTSFNPASLVITDASPKSSTLMVTTTASTPPGTYTVTVNSSSGALQHSASTSLVVQGTTSADLSLEKTASPNPAIVMANLTYRITVTNHGPSPATAVTVNDTLPGGVTFVSATPTQGNPCSGTTTVNCILGNIAQGGVATVSIVVIPQAAGQLTNTASVTAAESDSNASDNSTTVMTTVNTQASGPSMLDPNLSVHTVVSGLSQPTSMAFIGNSDFLVLEKDTGKVKRVLNGAVQSTVLDLPVNSASERGLLGIALHPAFSSNGYVYLYWTESSTGVDSTNLQGVPLLGNRVDRYNWNGSTLTFDRNLIRLRAYQADANQPLRGNHNGGVLRFGPDGKLFIIIGDNGRRGLLQNVTSGAPVPDDQFGGPEPDDAHLTGVILRLNDDGSTPTDNPFFNANSGLTGEAAANVKKIYAYGVRNSFGLAFDPLSGNLWDQENGDDAFDEMNRVTAGSNNGWVQIMGPVSRVGQYKQIESTYGAGNLQQLRWPPSLIADTAPDALARLYMLPGAHYNDPEFSWKYAVPAATMGFVQGRGLGPQFEGDMFVGSARTFLAGGFLFRFKLTADRLHFSFTDPRLTDLVADNLDKFDITESESLLIGKDFGITTDIETGPNGNLFVVSNTNSAVYEISGKQPSAFIANLNGAQEVPANNSPAIGTAILLLSPDEASARLSLSFSGLTSPETVAHIHGPAGPGVIAPAIFPLPQGDLCDFLITLSSTDAQNLKNGLLYINVHSNSFPGGEIRGQFQISTTAGINQSPVNHVPGNQNGVVGGTLVFSTANGNLISISDVDAGCDPAQVTLKATDGTLTLSTTSGLSFTVGDGTADALMTFTGSIANINAALNGMSNLVFGTGTIEITTNDLGHNGTGGPLTDTDTIQVTVTDNQAPLLLTIEGSDRAIALDSVTLLHDPFSLLGNNNFSSDHRTRIMLFALHAQLGAGEDASAVTAEADNAGTVIPLTVESVRTVPNFDWLTQVVVKFPPQFSTGGGGPQDVKVRIRLRGANSNQAEITVVPAPPGS
ncbi:MAG TPA: PQQ-dependent sugar dehydrogenase [Pyrinomonadaceae bacterium]